MSANNWTACPKCKRVAEENSAAMLAKAAKSYGKVPADKYEEAMTKARRAGRAENSASLREDWELGMASDGVFEVSYRCQCQNCDFTFSFKENRKVPY